MARLILIVNATQVVTSTANPYGILSVVSGYPKTFDSISYNNDVGLTLKMAKADYFKKLGANYEDTNPARVMTTVTLTAVDGRDIMHESVGELPVPVPEPELEPEPEEEPETPTEGE